MKKYEVVLVLVPEGRGRPVLEAAGENAPAALGWIAELDDPRGLVERLATKMGRRLADSLDERGYPDGDAICGFGAVGDGP